MEIPPPPLIGRPDRYNANPTLHITDHPNRQTFHAGPPLDPSPLFALSLAPAAFQGGKSEQDQETDREDQNVRALFCMMIQMQNIMKVSLSSSNCVYPRQIVFTLFPSVTPHLGFPNFIKNNRHSHYSGSLPHPPKYQPGQFKKKFVGKV